MKLNKSAKKILSMIWRNAIFSTSLLLQRWTEGESKPVIQLSSKNVFYTCQNFFRKKKNVPEQVTCEYRNISDRSWGVSEEK